MSISRRTADSFLTQCQLGREGIASKRVYPATAARSSSPIPWRSPSSRLACTFARTTETSARSTVRLNAYKGSSFQRRECLLFTCSDYSGNDDTGLGPDVLDVVAVEIATAANFAAGGSGVSGVWLCPEAHAPRVRFRRHRIAPDRGCGRTASDIWDRPVPRWPRCA